MYKLNYFNFKNKQNKYLLTNDVGEYIFLEKEDFAKLIKKEELKDEVKRNLLDKGFIYDTNKEIFADNISFSRVNIAIFWP